MDPLSVLNHLSKVLTVHEWAAFKETEDYLWMVARADNYKGPAMRQLVEQGNKRRQECWEWALSMASDIVTSEVAELGLDVPEEQRAKVVERMAEKLMIEQDLTPPSFTSWTVCDECGKVPVPVGFDEACPNCPWCMND